MCKIFLKFFLSIGRPIDAIICLNVYHGCLGLSGLPNSDTKITQYHGLCWLWPTHLYELRVPQTKIFNGLKPRILHMTCDQIARAKYPV